MGHVVAELSEWREFYLMLGAAAAALLALLFVAVSVAVGFVTRRSAAETRVYMSPVVVHFGTLIFLSGVALAPVKEPLLTIVVVGLAGVFGTVVAIVAAVHVFRHRGRLIVFPDHLTYGAIPVLGQIVIVVSAGLMAANNAWALHVLAAGLLILLVVNIRNTWDLVLTIVREQGRRETAKR
jgi:hypothetical protein